MRAFLALACDDLDDAFIRMQAALPKEGLTFPKTFHITLRFFTELDDEGYDFVIDKLSDLAITPFTVHLDRIGFFPNERFIRVVWVGVTPDDDAQKLKSEVDELLSDKWRPEKRFVPHVTLARVKRKCHGLHEAAKRIQVPGDSLTFSALHLIESRLTPQGPYYETKATFPFRQ